MMTPRGEVLAGGIIVAKKNCASQRLPRVNDLGSKTIEFLL
jgi:hypothetical protein